MQGTRANRRKRIIIESLFVVLLLAIIAIDQLTKSYFASNFNEMQKQVIIEDFFYFTHHRNSGSAWSFLSDVSWAQTFFKVLTVIALLAFGYFYYYSIKNNYKWLKVALVFTIAGTIGNFIDRLIFNEVIDFIGLIFWGYRFPVFNIADSFLVVGTIMIIVHLMFLDKNAIFKKNDEQKELSDN